MPDNAWNKPAADLVMQAIDLYLREAYPPPLKVPQPVRDRLEKLRSMAPESLYDCPVLEHASIDKSPPIRFALRLGNRFYPHMKLLIDRAPDGGGYLLRADTHDSHCQPRPGSPEQAAFADLCRNNRQIADAIESAWEQAGLPTFKKFLRDDLARRRGPVAGDPGIG